MKILRVGECRPAVSNSNGAAVEDDAVVPYQALEQVKVETPSEREEASHSRVKNKGNSCSSESSARGGLGTDKYGCKRDSPDDEPRETEHASRREPTSNGHCHGGKASIGSSEMGGVMKGDGIGPSGGSVSAVPESGWSRNIADGTFVKAADASAVIDALEGGNASEDSEGGGSSGSRELEHSTSRGEDATDMGRYDGGEHDENVADEEHVHPAADVSAGISVCMPTAEAAVSTSGIKPHLFSRVYLRSAVQPPLRASGYIWASVESGRSRQMSCQ